MPNFTQMTCHRCGETFPVGQAHTEVHCNQHLMEVARDKARRDEEAKPEPPYPPLETI